MLTQGERSQGERGKLEGWDKRIHTNIYAIDDQQGPPVVHRELDSIFFFFKAEIFIPKHFLFFFLISWRLITLQYYSGFCHTLK